MPALASPMEDILDASRVSFLGYFERKPRGMHLVIAGRAVRVLFQGYLERFGLAHGTQLWSCQRLHCATVPDITLWLCRARLHSARLPAYRLLSVSEAIDCCTGTLSVECVVRVAAVQPPFCGAVTHWVTGSLLVGCLSGNSCTRAAACCVTTATNSCALVVRGNFGACLWCSKSNLLKPAHCLRCGVDRISEACQTERMQTWTQHP
jgi:hypothetical protein